MTIAYLPTPVDEQAPDGHVSAMQLVHDARISYRQLDYWSRTGLINAKNAYQGSGSRRYYAIDQVHRAATIQWLLQAGISLQSIREVIDELLATGRAELTAGLVIHLPEAL